MKILSQKTIKKFKGKLCRILVNRNQRSICLFCTVKEVGEWLIYAYDTENKLISIPIRKVNGICINEEQW